MVNLKSNAGAIQGKSPKSIDQNNDFQIEESPTEICSLCKGESYLLYNGMAKRALMWFK